MVYEPTPGDWLYHEGYPVSTDYRGRRRGKLAEVASVDPIVLLREGEATRETVTLAHVTRWWNLFTPPANPDSIAPPTWMTPGETYCVQDYVATIRVVRGSWVSFLENGKGNNVLRIMAYRDFSRTNWVRIHIPSIYDWIRHPLV